MSRTWWCWDVVQRLVKFLAFGIVSTCAVWAAPDSTADEPGENRILLHIGHLNRDGRLDTIYGGLRRNLDVVPVRIAWGAATDSAGLTTGIKLPNWKRWHLSFAVEDINGDTTEDLVFMLHGTIRVQDQDRDTVRPLVVFGQSGLDTVRRINLNAITRGFQSAPFISMDLRAGEHLRGRARRDHSGLPSYELRRPRFVLDADSTGRAIASPRSAGMVAIFPNPTGNLATVRATDLEEGHYRLSLISVNGTRYAEVEVPVGPRRNFLESISVLDVPTGYYFVRVYRDNAFVGDFPVVVVH